MRSWIAAWVVAAIAGCGGQSLPPPRILSITPSEKLESDAVDVVVEVEAIMGFQVDYARSTASIDRTLSLSIGGSLVIGSGRYEPSGRQEAFIPSSLEAGTYDVLAQLADFRSGSLENGFLVHAGTWPGGYTVDLVAQRQQVNVPFLITIRATDPNASGFRGTVDLSVTSGVMNPKFTGVFENGVRVQSVVFTTPAPATLIQVRDLKGSMAQSNVFRVE